MDFFLGRENHKLGVQQLMAVLTRFQISALISDVVDMVHVIGITTHMCILV